MNLKTHIFKRWLEDELRSFVISPGPFFQCIIVCIDGGTSFSKQ